MRRLRSCQTGSTSVEFAIVSLVMMSAAFGVVEIGRALNVRNQLSQAADFGSRKVLTNKLIADSPLEAAVRSAFSAGSASALTVTLGSETVNGLQFRTIALSYAFTPLVKLSSNSTALTLTVNRRTPLI